MKLSLGFSPCPNDTFIFDALVNHQIDTEGLEFEVHMEDVQTLNQMVMHGELDISKISYGSLPLVVEKYVVLNSGSALGKGVGPLLVAPFAVPAPAVKECRIAIPGEHTTAHVLFSLAYPEATHKVFLRYDQIEQYVLDNTGSLENIRSMRLGVIIHENRFTYQDKGLVKETDLGNYWETETGLPVPLGGIVMRRNLDHALLKQVDKLIKRSVEHAYSRTEVINDFIRDNAQEMSDDVMKQHIDLYVNDFSLELGKAGKAAVSKFTEVHSSINKIPFDKIELFLQ
jgi:1,4-dihydroxy-6-naphthoate synthase